MYVCIRHFNVLTSYDFGTNTKTFTFSFQEYQKKNQNLRKKFLISFFDLIVSHKISSNNSNVKIKSRKKCADVKQFFQKHLR